MKKFTVPCDFNGVKSPFTIYVGSPKEDHHPIQFQSDWLSKERGGTVPQDVMESLSQLRDIANKNGVSFEDLCVYALGAAQQESSTDEDTSDEGSSENDTPQDSSDEETSEDDTAQDSSDDGTSEVDTTQDSSDEETSEDDITQDSIDEDTAQNTSKERNDNNNK